MDEYAEHVMNLAHDLADLAREHRTGTLIVHLPSGTAAWWNLAPAEVGHDCLVLRLLPGSPRRESAGDLLARCLRIVEEELDRYENRHAMRRQLGLPPLSQELEL